MVHNQKKMNVIQRIMYISFQIVNKIYLFLHVGVCYISVSYLIEASLHTLGDFCRNSMQFCRAEVATSCDFIAILVQFVSAKRKGTSIS